MTTGPRDYTSGTRAALAALSNGTCYYPGCTTPILTFIDGEPFINYEIAHIRDAKVGNRYDPDMVDDERRAFANLVLLCKPHHTLVDKTHPGRYAVQDLQLWKAEREAQGIAGLAGLRGLTEERLEEWIVAAVTSATDASSAAAVVGVAKAAAALVSNVITSRAYVAYAATLWGRTWESTRSSLLAWDPETGERLYAEPPANETDRHRRAVAAALATAIEQARGDVASVRTEVAGVRATSVVLRPWCDAVIRATDTLMEAAGRWPTPPPFEDDSLLPDAVDALNTAVDSLSAKWRNEDVPEAVAPEPPPEPKESEPERLFREHTELLDESRRYARARGLPYDRKLALRLFDASPFASNIPPIPSLWPYCIDTTASLLADVARNATDHEFEELIELCECGPFLAGVLTARAMRHTANEAELPERSRRATATVELLFRRADWSRTELWDDVGIWARVVLSIEASVETAETVAALLEAGLGQSPLILPSLIEGCAEWIEQRDSRDFSRFLGQRRRYSMLPDWFPTSSVVEGIREAYPRVRAAEEPHGDADDVESLASQILYLAAERR